MKLATALAVEIHAAHDSKKDDLILRAKHLAAINELLSKLPGNSSHPCETSLDLYASHADRLVFNYRHTHDDGEKTLHTISVTPTFSEFAYRIRVTGRDRGAKQNISMMFHLALQQEMYPTNGEIKFKVVLDKTKQQL